MTDAIDLSAALIVNAPDVRAWPATAEITHISFDGSTSRIQFTKQAGPDRWPDVVPPGFDGPIQYTWWLFRRISGRWVGSAFIEMWYGRDGSGSPDDPDVPSRYHLHWYYGDRWAPLSGSGPIQPGEPIGFMVTSGDQRDKKGADSVRQRSNVVVVPATDIGAFTFETSPATPDTPTTPTTPTAPPSSGELSAVTAALTALSVQVQAIRDELGVVAKTQQRGLSGRVFGATVTLTPPKS